MVREYWLDPPEPRPDFKCDWCDEGFGTPYCVDVGKDEFTVCGPCLAEHYSQLVKAIKRVLSDIPNDMTTDEFSDAAYGMIEEIEKEIEEIEKVV